MKQSTKYQYEKRIKELQAELQQKENSLYEYKQLSLEIFNAVTQMIQDGKQVNQGWLITKFRRVFR